MKSKKLFLPSVILILAIIAMAVYCAVTNIAKKPVIAEQDFPFSITYELNGKTETIDGVYSVRFTGNDGYIDATNRIYEGVMVSQRESDETSFVLGESEDGVFILYTQLYPDYLMGDAHYDYYLYDPYAPMLTYNLPDGVMYNDPQTVAEFGGRILSWEYPEPIENSFVFSHIAHLNGNVVFPTAIIALLALVAVLIFVKKDKYFIRRPIDVVSVVLSVLILVLLLPFILIYGYMSDIVGSNGSLTYALGYLAPATILLGLAASIALRRKSYHISGFFVQFVGPLMFALHILLLYLA